MKGYTKVRLCFSDTSRFHLVDREGKLRNNGSGILLWNNMHYGRMDSVCKNHFQPNYDFSDNAAHAVCRDMGWSHAIGWDGISPGSYVYDKYYDTIAVECTSPYWVSCSYRSAGRRCEGAFYVIFLTCGLTERLIQGM